MYRKNDDRICTYVNTSVYVCECTHTHTHTHPPPRYQARLGVLVMVSPEDGGRHSIVLYNKTNMRKATETLKL
jgi:hypothetical protein